MVMGPQMLGRNRPPAQRATLRVMYGYIRPHRLALLAGALLSLATGATGLVLPLVVRALINDLSGHRGLSHLIVIMSLLMLADAVLGAAGGYLLLRTADSIVLHTRKSLISRLLRITIGALDRSEPGDLMARATVDTTLLRAVVSNAADESPLAACSIAVPARAGGNARHTPAELSTADLIAGPHFCSIRPENWTHTKKRMNSAVMISRVRRFASKRSNHAYNMRLKSRFISAEQASASAAHHFRSGRAIEIPTPMAMCHRIPANANGSARP